VAPPPPPPPPAAEAVPVPAEPPARRRPRLLFAAALIPVAALGLAFGVGWNPFGGSDIAPTTAAAPATPGHIGTATSAPAATTTSKAAPPASTAPPASKPAHTRARTTTPTHATTHAGAGSPTTGAAGTPKTATTKHTQTTAPPRSATTKKAPPKPPTIQPSHVFAWPAAPNASFYLVSFMRDGKKVFEKRVTEPRLTLPGSFRFTAGSYRWVVLPATGSAGNPQYAPAIIDSKFVVA
jgi:hypothetical protein